jgi:DNA-binding transcriptional LysR family regulator
VRPDHRIAGLHSVAPGELAAQSWIMPSGTGRPGYQAAIFLETCRRNGFEPRVVESANSIETMLGLVTAGLGIALAPWSVALTRPVDLVLVEIEGESLDMVAVRTEHSVAANVFIAVARAVVGRLLEDME